VVDGVVSPIQMRHVGLDQVHIHSDHLKAGVAGDALVREDVAAVEEVVPGFPLMAGWM